MQENDAVNHPAHYTSHPSKVECITVTEHMGFNLGNAMKYIWRADLKNDAIEDLKKAHWYIERELQRRGAAIEHHHEGTEMKIKLTEEQIKKMVDRFLSWRLPEHFHPDAGISFAPEYNVEHMAKQGRPPLRHEPTGTNLFGADQARAMILHMLGDDA